MTENASKPSMPRSEAVVTLGYADLTNKSSDVFERLEAGFGPSGLGIIAITDVPGYPQLRKKLLPLAQRVATLPDEVRRQLEDPPSRYSFGWSHGKEKLETGRPDQLKGSFYANLCQDALTTSTVLMQRYPTQCRNNIWPNEHVPELELVMKELGSVIMEVGFLLAYHCDKYVSSRNSEVESLERILQRSQCHKGRLLHYFPSFDRLDLISRDGDMFTDMFTNTSSRIWVVRMRMYQLGVDGTVILDLSQVSGGSTLGKTNLCENLHRVQLKQNSAIVFEFHPKISFVSPAGLTCAMYTKGGVEVPSPDPEAGLYIENREGKVVKAVYNSDYLAFQMGEATEILSEGLFHATPHCVKAPRQEILGVERNSFAVFMQPQWDEPLNVAQVEGESLKKVGEEFSSLSNFGDFSELKLLKYNYDPSVDIVT